MSLPFSRALAAENLKMRRSGIFRLTIFIFVIFLPLICALIMLIIRYPELAAHSSVLRIKAQSAATAADWSSFYEMLQQAGAIGGMILYGFVASWTFGREYADRTLKDLLALPVSRNVIVSSKLVTIFLWCGFLSVSAFFSGHLAGWFLGLPGWNTALFTNFALTFGASSLLTILLCAPVAFFACLGQGYLVPLAFVILSMILAQITAAAGWGAYFPWAVPALMAATAGPASVPASPLSSILVMITSGAGVIGTLLYWNNADHTR